MRALMMVLVALLAVAASPLTADATCVGHLIEHDVGSVDRDGTIHVVGLGWGDDCHDTGSIPPGESVLGLPVVDIEVLLVQDGVEHLVATGDADEKFGFTADVAVPDALKPGPVEVVARAEDAIGHMDTTEALVVSDADPSGKSDDAVVRLGASPPDTVELPRTRERSSFPSIAVLGVGLLAAGFVVVRVYWTHRRGRD